MKEAIRIVEVVKDLEKRPIPDWEGRLIDENKGAIDSNINRWKHIYEKTHPRSPAAGDIGYREGEAIIRFKLSDEPSKEWLAAFKDALRENSEKCFRVESMEESQSIKKSNEIDLIIPPEGVKIPGRDTQMLGISRETAELAMSSVKGALKEANRTIKETLAAANEATLFDEDALFSPSNLNPPEQK